MVSVRHPGSMSVRAPGRIKRVPKVERPGSGDDTRHWGPPWTLESSSYFESANRSKKSIELDLGNPANLEVARRLALRADLATSLDLDPIVSFGDESCSQVRHPISYSATP